ncbi:MAG: hypothetical protein ACTHNZ_22405 [Trinickia sp.]|jgi:hypothetical protein|uniref:hypothetical protein n=1 Tax=Trinickia sp. TaxID=2571163 RepID=UPI003F80FF79
MSRTSAVGLLVDTRQALTTDIRDKPHDTQRSQQMLQDVERLLLDVRIGRTREFMLEFPNRIHVIVSD